MIRRTLSALGLGKKPTQPIQSEIAEYAADLKRANEARDNWRDSSKEWEAKFKTAIGNLAVASTDLADLRATFNQRLADAVQDYQADAQKWRDSLKRSRDRKAAKKTAPARDKRAKRGGK
jgi:Skp family chaperone for outer membrane proteins